MATKRKTDVVAETKNPERVESRLAEDVARYCAEGHGAEDAELVAMQAFDRRRRRPLARAR